VRWDWLADNGDKILRYLTQHIRITLVSLLLGVLVAVPLGIVGHRVRRSYPVILVITSVIYSIPSIALFVFLIPSLGLNDRPVIVGLAAYTLVILVRNIVEGLRSVPEPVREAASAMGYGDLRRLFQVEFPLALPAIVAGLRVTAVSTISLVSVGALVGTGGLGQLFTEGAQIDNPIETWAGVVLTVLLALVLDVIIVIGARLAAPWTRAGR
jgi:osmoprotectant transport system permease protein